MIEAYDSVLNLKGDDGNYFIIGFEHWCLYDDGVNNWSETDNFGIATLQDNAYDGVEARAPARTPAATCAAERMATMATSSAPGQVSACDTAEDQEIIRWRVLF